MDVLMPGPGRREDEIALLHRTRLAIHDRGRARALEHETQGIHRVAVRSRLLARQQNLDVGRERPRGLLLVLLVRYRRDELQHPPFDHLRRGNVDGGGDQRSDLVPRPQISCLRQRRRPMRPRILPQRCKIGLLPCLADFADIGPGGGGHGAQPFSCRQRAKRKSRSRPRAVNRDGTCLR